MTEAADVEPTRRDFLYVATASAGATGALAAVWPLIAQMNPDAATIAAGYPVDVDVSKIEPGQQIVVRWREKPVFIVNRPPQALEVLQEQRLRNRLLDPDSQEHQQPPYAENWHRSAKPGYLILVGICTHLGCIPHFYPQPSEGFPTGGWLGGYFCTCHGSMYDLAGRVFRGVPAPYNLPVPPYRFLNDATVRIGENPPNINFDFSSIRQI